jgi:hypothetical protein
LYGKLCDQTLVHNPFFANSSRDFQSHCYKEDNPRLIFFSPHPPPLEAEPLTQLPLDLITGRLYFSIKIRASG